MESGYIKGEDSDRGQDVSWLQREAAVSVAPAPTLV